MHTKNLRDGKLIARESAVPWQAETAYASGAIVRPTTRNSYLYECTTPGTTDSDEPTWGTTPTGTTSDGTAVWTCRAAAEVEVKFIDEGSLSWDEAHNYQNDMDRGVLKGRRPGDEEECKVSFGVKYTAYQSEAGDSEATVVDALKKAGKVESTWNSGRPSHEPHALDLIFKVLHADKGDYEVVMFPDFAVQKISVSEGDDKNVIEVEGGALAVEPTITWESAA